MASLFRVVVRVERGVWSSVCVGRIGRVGIQSGRREAGGREARGGGGGRIRPPRSPGAPRRSRPSACRLPWRPWRLGHLVDLFFHQTCRIRAGLAMNPVTWLTLKQVPVLAMTVYYLRLTRAQVPLLSNDRLLVSKPGTARSSPPASEDVAVRAGRGVREGGSVERIQGVKKTARSARKLSALYSPS